MCRLFCQRKRRVSEVDRVSVMGGMEKVGRLFCFCLHRSQELLRKKQAIGKVITNERKSFFTLSSTNNFCAFL